MVRNQKFIDKIHSQSLQNIDNYFESTAKKLLKKQAILKKDNFLLNEKFDNLKSVVHISRCKSTGCDGFGSTILDHATKFHSTQFWPSLKNQSTATLKDTSNVVATSNVNEKCF